MFFLVGRRWSLYSFEESDYRLYTSFRMAGKTKFLSKLRVYLTGADIWEHSNIKDGWDPEQSRDVKELGRYPFNRTYTVGINATF